MRLTSSPSLALSDGARARWAEVSTSAGARGGKAGFGQGVFDEGMERLFGFADAECRLGHQLDAEWSKQ